VREQRGKLGLVLVSGAVLISLIGLTCWNVFSRNRELEARSAKLAAPVDEKELKEAKAELELELESEEGTKGLPESAATPAAGAVEKRTVSDKQRELEAARNQYLSRPAPGAASRGADEGKGSGEAEVSAAEKERVLRQVMPFYRSPDKRNAPPVPAEELYIKTPEKKK
jgi:hypothetical protein